MCLEKCCHKIFAETLQKTLSESDTADGPMTLQEQCIVGESPVTMSDGMRGEGKRSVSPKVADEPGVCKTFK